jgi:DNA-binding transcriptional LysR family regulator
MKINSENLNINLRHLRALSAVADTGSFAMAAAQLGIVPSALSELIGHLEEAIGAPLFDRRTRPPAMTPLARTFLEDTAPLLNGLDLAITRLRQRSGLEIGSLSIGASPSAISELLAPQLAFFLADKPQVRCVLHDDVAETLAQMVVQGRLDMAVAGRAMHSADLRQSEILRDEFGLACRRDDALAQSPIMLDDLEGRTLIGLAPQTGTHQILAKSGLPQSLLETRINAYSTIAQLCMIRAGLGVALLPKNAVTLFNDPDIAFVTIRDLELQRVLYLIEPERRPLTPIAQAFRDQLSRLILLPA